MAEIRETLRLTDLNLDEVNRVLGRLQDRLDEQEGRRGTPSFQGAIDMGGHRITNAGASSADTDATVRAEVQGNWPVGSIFISVVSTNPATLLGFGTWEAFGAGKFLVGLDADDADFDTAEGTGGNKTKDLSHTHSISHTHIDNTGANELASGTDRDATYSGDSGSGGSATQDILPPYQVVYFWLRTA